MGYTVNRQDAFEVTPMWQRLRAIKTLFAAAALCLVGGIVASVILVRDDPFFRTRSLLSELRGVLYRIEWGLSGSGSVRALLPFEDSFSKKSQGPPATSLPILVYHGILPRWDGTQTNISREKFREQMFALRRAGYQTVDTKDVEAFLRGEGKLPSLPVMITFDDGRKDSYYEADPVLAALGMKGVMFAIAKYNLSEEGSNYYLERAEILRMKRSGRWDIESHSFDGHGLVAVNEKGEVRPFYTALLWREGTRETMDEYSARVREDLEAARREIAEALGKDVRAFALPFGDFGQNLADSEFTKVVLSQAGATYGMIFFQEASPYRFSQVTRSSAESPYLLRRMSVNPEMSGEELLALLENGRAKELPFEARLTKKDGWIPSWGRAVADGTLRLIPQEESTGAAVLLDGSELWEDYTVRADVETNGGVFVWVRFKNDAQNAACNFGDGFAHVEQVVDGVKTVLRGIRGPGVILPQRATIEARVEGRTLSCVLNGKVLVESRFLDESLKGGGIGFKTWDAAVKSFLTVHSLFVARTEER